MMAVNTKDVRNALQQRAQGTPTKGETVMDLIKRMEPAFKQALPKQISADRFARIAMTAVRNNPTLQKCNPMSFLAALMQSAQLGLEPNTPLGQAYIIPYGNEAQFQLGYQGLLTLAHRTGEYQQIYAMAVHVNDDFEYEYGLEPKLLHKPSEIPVGEPTHYYAVYRLVNGGYGFAVMSRQEVEMHRDRFSPSAKRGSSPWKTDFDAMALKTVLKKALKYAPKSVELAVGVSADETIKVDIADDMADAPTVDSTADDASDGDAEDAEDAAFPAGLQEAEGGDLPI